MEERFRGERICRPTTLHGCDDEQGKEVVPFIHEGEFSPVTFSPSGFAVVLEAYRGPDEEGGWFYIDAEYKTRFAALGIEGIPDVLLPASDSEPGVGVHIGRYLENGLIGYLDLNKGIITSARFTAAFSFNGDPEMHYEVLVCEDCHPERWSMCPPKEAHCTGMPYLIDRSGQRLRKEPDKRYGEYWWCKTHPGRKDPRKK